MCVFEGKVRNGEWWKTSHWGMQSHIFVGANGEPGLLVFFVQVWAGEEREKE